MGLAPKGPRLWLRKRPNRSPVWLIRDGEKSFGTGTADEVKATEALKRYKSSPKYFRTQQRHRRGRIDPLGVIWLYVVEIAAEDRPVKIGVAKDVRARLWNIQVGTPFPINLVASIQVPHMVENAVHVKLADAKIRGEWFKRTPAVEAIIATIQDGTIVQSL